MKRCSLLLIVALVAGAASLIAQSDPFSTDAKGGYTSIKDILLKSADKMSEENYAFRTTPQVRTFGEMIAHVADSQTMLCSTVGGQVKRGNAGALKTKAELVAALRDSFATCDAAYNSITDATGAQMIKMFGRDVTKLGALHMNVAHLNEMYGQMVAYMRIKGIVPPSSEGRM